MSKENPRDRKRLLKRLKNRYRLVLMNDTTFDERFSAYLTPINVIAGVVFIFLVITAVVVGTIVFSPLKEYIPGYSDTQTRLNAVSAAVKADSLEQAQAQYVQYFASLQRVLNNDLEESEIAELSSDSIQRTYEGLDFSVSEEDKRLRAEVEAQEQYALSTGSPYSAESIGLPGIFFFTPVRGVVTASFDFTSGHLGIDLATEEGEPVNAVYDGTIVMASFTSDGGNVIQIQHPNNLISVYKHNAVLLKKVGDQVKSGQSIAISGNTGEFSDGPHLHFELWYNGTPLNPQEFIAFSS